MTIKEILLESKKQRKKENRKSEYGRIRLDGEDVRLHVAVKATGKTIRELLALKQKPIEKRKKIEKTLADKIREWQGKKKEVDHVDGNKNNNSSSNLKPLDKSKHTAKTNKTR